jgi:hypothetical protein
MLLVMGTFITKPDNSPTAIAYDRGFDRGTYDREDNNYNDAPLSGQWAGESITDLLGDLFENFEDGTDNIQELCDSYEAGYSSAWEN